MSKLIRLGFEVGSGREVGVRLAHTVITGLTQEAGKTTCIMGLVKRSGLRALIFKTKIGEKAISEGVLIPPFYREDFDWEYASELLESSRKEKLKFERSWIIKYSKSASNLLEFKRNIDEALVGGKLRELEKSVLITLQAYLEKILPELQYAPLSKTLELRDGVNVMDLERFKEETQSLIIRSVLNEVLNREKGCLIVLPECWKYLPEKLASPVKRPAEAFVRQGATNNNFLFLDSQDITGISKTILKQVSNWCLGYQREINEINRTLDQIPLSKRVKPKAEDVASLKLGQFFVATSDFTKKVFAQPSWLSDEVAVRVARGELDVSQVEKPLHIAPFQVLPVKQDFVGSGVNVDFNKKVNELREDFISNRNDIFTKLGQVNDSISKLGGEVFKLQGLGRVDEDEIVLRVLQKIPSQHGQVVDKQEIINSVLERMPKSVGANVYEVAPLEKIRKDFLQEAKDKVVSDVNGLGEKAKRVLKYLESRGVGCSTNEICMKCFMYPQSGGGYARMVNDAVKELVGVLVAEKMSNGNSVGKLKERIKSLLGSHEASDVDVQSVYDHILVELLK